MLSTTVSCLPGVTNTAELFSRGLRSIGRRLYGSGQKSGALVLIWSLWRNFEAAAFKSVPKVRWVALCRSTNPKNSPLRHVRSAAWRPSPLRTPYQMLATGGSPLSRAAESRVSGGKLLAAAVESFGCRPCATIGVGWRAGVRKPSGEEAAVSGQSGWRWSAAMEIAATRRGSKVGGRGGRRLSRGTRRSLRCARCVLSG